MSNYIWKGKEEWSQEEKDRYLKEKYNPEGSQMRRIQLRQLEILQYIKEVCVQNNIPFWLTSGTLLGAVRHEGFIPWDDDVDIEMLDKDYKRFCKAVLKNPHPIFKLQNHHTDKNYFARFAKIRDTKSYLEETRKGDRWFTYRGLYVDIFILEKSRCVWWARITRSIQRKLVRASAIETEWKAKLKIRFFYTIQCILCTIGKLFSYNLPSQQSAKEKAINGECMRHRLGTGFLRPRFYNEIFPLKECNFEGDIFPCPGKSDQYLARIYGNDFRSLPDLEKLHHHISKVILDKRE